MRTHWLRGRFFLLFVGLFLSTLPVSTYGQDVRVGLRAGPSVSSVHGEAEDITVNGQLNLSPTFGPALSGFVEVQQGKWIVPRVELTYVQKGTTVRGRVKLVCIAPCPNAFTRVDETYRVSYLEIPAIGGVRFPLFGPWASEIVAGQYLGVKLRADGPGGKSSEQVRQTTYGILTGVALEYAVGTGNAIALDVRYSRALTSLSFAGDLQGLRIDGVTVGLEYSLVP